MLERLGTFVNALYESGLNFSQLTGFNSGILFSQCLEYTRCIFLNNFILADTGLSACRVLMRDVTAHYF